VLKGRDRLGFPHEPRQLGRAGVFARQQHLQRRHAVELEVADAVDDAAPPAPEHAEHGVAGNVRQTLPDHGG
jgi:hypothetical protein